MKNICHEPSRPVNPSNTTGSNDDTHAMMSKKLGPRQASRERLGTAGQTKTR